MQIQPKTIEEARDLVFHIFMQGDTRNFDSYYHELIANFILNNILIINLEEFALKEHCSEDLNRIKGPQKSEKFSALEIIKLKNLKFEGFEMPLLNYQVDIIAKKGKKVIAIECGPTRLWKAIDYLEAGAELWITRDDKNTQLFTLTKGETWDVAIKELEQMKREELKKVKSPIDTLF